MRVSRQPLDSYPEPDSSRTPMEPAISRSSSIQLRFSVGVRELVVRLEKMPKTINTTALACAGRRLVDTFDAWLSGPLPDITERTPVYARALSFMESARHVLGDSAPSGRPPS